VDVPLSDDLLALQEFTAQQGATIIQEIASTTLPGNLRPHEQDIQDYLPLLFRDAVDVLLQRYEDSRPTLNQGIPTSQTCLPQSASSESGYGSADLEGNSNHCPPSSSFPVSLTESAEGYVTAGIEQDSLLPDMRSLGIHPLIVNSIGLDSIVPADADPNLYGGSNQDYCFELDGDTL
jgi:hypothetical protein